MAGGDWDSLVRGVSLAASLLILSLFWWPKPARLVTLSGSLLAAATIAFNLLRFAPAAPLHDGLIVLAMSAPFWFWAVIQCLFEDRSRLPKEAWAVLAVLIGAALLTQTLPQPERSAAAFLVRALGLVLVAHAGWIVWRGRQTDLVAGRLHLRTALFVALCLGVAGFVVLAVLWPLLTGNKPNGTLGMAIIALFQLAACYLLFSPNRALIARPSHAPPAPSPEAQRLLNLMATEAPWKDPELTVAGLATRLALPEYRLRKLINETLGHRNFAAFLNAYRLQAAAEALRRDLKTPILTIALDHGFGSIGPFNRAFRERYAMTPSQWRRGEA